jgi:hypothetical protein
MLWIVGSLLLLIWATGLLLHKGGFIHVLLLAGAAVIIVECVARYRAAVSK